MPPAVAIPVINRTQPGTYGNLQQKKALKNLPPSRKYDDGPLPIKPSDHAPRNARITGRIIHEDRVTYQLKIGDVSIDDVGIEEILDYVSPLDLEDYENRQFLEERQVLKALEDARRERKREKLERQKERAKRKGVVIFEEVESTEEVTEGGDEVVDEVVGKHGRARPTYTHLFKKLKGARRRRKTDGDSSELMSLSGDEGISTENEDVRQSAVVQPSAPVSELPKRRRRKRDKATGELLPLSPVAQQTVGTEKKRQRRKRHPQTGELMPVGWSYDPNNDNVTYEERRQGLAQQSFRKLSISQGHDAKRQRLDTGSSVSGSVSRSVSRSLSPLPTKAQLAAQHSPMKDVPKPGLKTSPHKTTVVELSTSDEEPEIVSMSSKTPTVRPLKLPPSSATPKTNMNNVLNPARTPSALQSISAAAENKHALQTFPGKGMTSTSSMEIPKTASLQRSTTIKTSIMNPSATRDSSTEPPAYRTEDEENEDDLDEPEWYIEAITDHRSSDPKTHPPAFGKDPVMLYLVKWEGFDEMTWEPKESFGDRSVVKDYRKRVGLDSDLSDEEIEVEDDTIIAPAANDEPAQPSTAKASQAIVIEEDEEDEDDDEEEFVVEAIISHHLSDPRTHPPELGRTPVLLYQVKWEGYTDPTWEPASSFEDKSILQNYHERISQRSANGNHS